MTFHFRKGFETLWLYSAICTQRIRSNRFISGVKNSRRLPNKPRSGVLDVKPSGPYTKGEEPIKADSLAPNECLLYLLSATHKVDSK
jgi:hypothetical protein